MSADQIRAADSLDRWWDAYQHGEISGDIPIDDMHLIEEITAMYAQAVSPPAEQRVWRQTMAQIADRRSTPVDSIKRMLRLDATRTLTWPERKPASARLRAVAIIAIVTVASLILGSINGGDSHRPAILAPSGGTPAATLSPAASPAMSSLTLDWTSYGGTGGAFSSPTEIAIAPNGDIWVVDGGNNRIKILNPDGSWKETWGAAGSGDGQFNFWRSVNTPLTAAGGIAFAPDGTLYVADTANQRVQKFSADRTFLQGWGNGEPNGVKFVEPIGVAVDADGNVLVFDATTGRVRKFSPDGEVLSVVTQFSGSAELLSQGGHLALMDDGTLVVAEAYASVRVFGADGSLRDRFALMDESGELIADIADVAVDGDGNIYVVERSGNRLLEYDATGRLLLTSVGEHLDEFYSPAAVSVAADGSVYIVDYQANRVQKFTVTSL